MNIQFTISNSITTIGLILDILGALLLFKYGLPSEVKSHGGVLLREESREAEKIREDKNNTIMFRGKLGLALLIGGFVFQLVGGLVTSQC